MTEIGLWGVVRNGTNDGYGYAGFKMVQALEKFGIKCNWEDIEVPIALSFIQPELYGGRGEQYRIGYTPWESTELKEGWADLINLQNEFWTTSYFCADVFKEQGVTLPIKVVHHGLDGDDWTLAKRQKQNPFIFLHQGEPADRKGSQMTFDAFKKVFKGYSDVYLVFKSSASWVECRWYDSEGSIIGPVDDWPNVQLIRGVLNQPELNELLHKVHCMVYPSNGEGFGLIPFQAAGTGLPTIAPAWGGIADFEEYLTNPMGYTVGPSNHGYHLGDWCWPDFDSLCEQMLSVYENYEKVSEDAYEKAVGLRAAFQWDKIFEPIADHLKSI